MEIQSYIAAHRERFMEEWASLIRIPSVSCQEEHKADMLRCAERWRELLLQAGCQRAEIIPSAGVLITDGLADAVKRIAAKTGLGAKVYADRIPFEGNSFELGRKLDLDPVSAAMNGGEDYQLLYVVPILKLDKFRHDFQTFDIIGHLAQKEVGTVLVTPEGVELPLRAQGWKEDENE